MRRAASYITPHHGGGWRYNLHIPAEVRPMFEGKKAFTGYIPRMTRREAEAIAREWAVEHAAQIAVHREMSPRRWERIRAAGGLEAVRAMSVPTKPLLVATQDPETGLVHRRLNPTMSREQVEATIDQSLVRADADYVQWRVEQQPKQAAALALVSWDALQAQWAKMSGAGYSRTRAIKTTTRLLREFFGERDVRTITPAEVAKWRDTFAKRSVARTRLSHLHALYKAAAKEPGSPFHGLVSPAQGVGVPGKRDPKQDGSDKVFSGEQVRHILETAKATRFGGERADDVLRMLRLMAFHPMRPQEVAQLQGGDVLIEHGIKVLRVQAKDAITGNEHPQKSVKTAARLIPLHPAVADFYEHARKFGKDEFIFGKFKWNEGKGRAGWLMDKFPMFLRDKAKIREPTKRLVLYSLRHTFITAMRSAGVPEAEAKRLAGHGGDIHARYGGAELKLLADCIARTNPLELQA